MEPWNRIGRFALVLVVAVVIVCEFSPCAIVRGARALAAGGRSTGAPAVATVTSADGTKIEVERSGSGPALVIVGAALSTRADSARLAELLSERFTVHNYDRRGRGGSGDAKEYAVEREIEDIAAVIQGAGGTAFLYGGSSGAALALEAANRLGKKVPAVAIFEPPYIVDDSRKPIPEGFPGEIRALVAEGKRGDAVAKFMTVGIGLTDEMLANLRASPAWPKLEQLAHTLPYDLTILAGLQSGKPLPAKRWKSVAARVLVIDGEKSDPFLRSAAEAVVAVLQGAERRTIAGQDHALMFRAPELLVPVLGDFFAAKRPERGKKP